MRIGNWGVMSFCTTLALLSGVALLGGGTRQKLSSTSLPPDALPARRPATCTAMTPATGLQVAIDAVPVGGALCLAGGSYSGPIVVGKALTLWGPRSAVIRSTGQGSTLTITGEHIQLLGFTIRGSGHRFDLNDSALKVTGRHILIQGLRLEGPLFGLTAEQASGVTFRGNEIAGDSQRPMGLRGDAVRLWQTRNSIVENNRITGCRDIIIWYSSHNRVANNFIDGGRYGTHFMYSDHQEVVNNRYYHNVVGIFSMYAHSVTIRSNLIEDSSQYDGMGIGVKDSDRLLVENNRLIRDNIGIYLDASPATPETRNRFRQNLVALNNIGVTFHATESNISFTQNSFRSNQIVTSVEGNGDALAAEWSENYFDDYQGYDLNHDGLGDVPFELRSFSTDLTDRYPNLAFFRGSPAINLMEFFSKVFPYLQPKLILRDSRPAMNAENIPGVRNAY